LELSYEHFQLVIQRIGADTVKRPALPCLHFKSACVKSFSVYVWCVWHFSIFYFSNHYSDHYVVPGQYAWSENASKS